jgi:hypothetical protein
MGSFNPDKDSVNIFCESLLTLVEMYGELSVIAAVPAALEGRAEKWFKAHGMPREKMRSIHGWIEELTEEFKVNTAVAREKARQRRYNPNKDESVDDYFYDKVNLVRAAEAGITAKKTVEEVWMGLPPDFQALLDFDEMVLKSVSNFGHALRTKDLSYRAMMNRRHDAFSKKDGNGEGRYERREWRNDKPREERRSRSDGKYEKRDRPQERDSKGRNNENKQKDARRGDGKEDLPPRLPKEKWRKDDKGRTMRRKCRFCNKWHMDYDCLSRPASYSLTAAVDDQRYSSSDEDADASDLDDDSSASTSSAETKGIERSRR